MEVHHRQRGDGRTCTQFKVLKFTITQPSEGLVHPQRFWCPRIRKLLTLLLLYRQDLVIITRYRGFGSKSCPIQLIYQLSTLDFSASLMLVMLQFVSGCINKIWFVLIPCLVSISSLSWQHVHVPKETIIPETCLCTLLPDKISV